MKARHVERKPGQGVCGAIALSWTPWDSCGHHMTSDQLEPARPAGGAPLPWGRIPQQERL